MLNSSPRRRPRPLPAPVVVVQRDQRGDLAAAIGYLFMGVINTISPRGFELNHLSIGPAASTHGGDRLPAPLTISVSGFSGGTVQSLPMPRRQCPGY